jgi:hypothetical protein
MRMVHLILVLLLVVSALLAWIVFSVEPPMTTGAAHPEFAGMRIGGDGSARLSTIGNLGYWMQVAILALVILFIAAGVQKQRRTIGFWGPIIAVGLMYQWVWWKIWQGYLYFLQTGETSYTLGFTTPSAWMVFGVWTCGFFLMLIYVVGFRKFIFSKEDEAKYEQLLEDVKQGKLDPGGDD